MLHILGELKPFSGHARVPAASKRRANALSGACILSLSGLLMLSGAACADARADGDPSSPEDVLKGKGLKRVDTKYLLEAEAAAGEEFRKALPDFNQLHALALRQTEIMYNDALLAQGGEYRLDLIRDVEALHVEIDTFPIRRTNLQQAVYDQWISMRKALNVVDRQLDGLRRQMPMAKERDHIRSELKRLCATCLERIRELSYVFDPLMAKYRDLARDRDVSGALRAMKRATGINVKLGPSDQFRDAHQRLLAAKNDLDPQPKKIPPRQKPKSRTSKKPAA
jgi:hypothetical protein